MARRNPIGNNHRLHRFVPALIFGALLFAGGSNAIAQPFQVGFGIRIERTNNLLTWKWDTAMVRASTWLKTVLDSALARDSTFARRYHEWNAEQMWSDSLGSAERAYPWSFRTIDTIPAFGGFSFLSAYWTNGPVGSPDYTSAVMQFGYNLDKRDAARAAIGFSIEPQYYVSGAWHSEFHGFFSGVYDLGIRWLTLTGRWSDGRVTSMGLAADRLDITNGGTNNGIQDSIAFQFVPRGFGSLGYMAMLNGSFIRMSAANSLGFQAFNGTIFSPVLQTAANTQIYIGASGWTDVNLQAGSKMFTLNSGGIISQNCIVGADGADTTHWVITFNQWGHMIRKWLPATLSLTTLRDSLNAAFTLTSGRRINVANLSLGTNGQYLVMFGGSPTWITPTWATSLEIADSIAVLFGGPRKFHHTQIDFTGFSAGISTDSVKRLGREYAFTSVFVPAVTDTNQTRYFGLANSNGGYATNRAAMLITDRTLIVRSIAMVHVWDSSSAAAYFQRDTVVENTSMDSIPRGSTVWIQYRGAAVFGSPGVQTVRIWYKLQNNTTHDAAGLSVRVPFILGVQDRHMGLGGYVSSSHSLTVTVVLAEKVPGLVY